MNVNQSFEIQRPAADVFAVLADPARLPEWQRNTVEVCRERTGPLVAGERFDEVHAAMGKRNRSTVEVVACDAPHRLALRIADGPLPFDGEWRLEPAAGGGTRVEFAGELRAGGLKRLLRPLVARQFRTHHAHLRELL